MCILTHMGYIIHQLWADAGCRLDDLPWSDWWADAGCRLDDLPGAMDGERESKESVQSVCLDDDNDESVISLMHSIDYFNQF